MYFAYYNVHAPIEAKEEDIAVELGIPECKIVVGEGEVPTVPETSEPTPEKDKPADNEEEGELLF